MVKVIDNTVAAFLKYRNDASTAAIERAVDAIVEAYNSGRQIQFFGVGNSGIVAQDGQHKFFRLGVQSVAYSDGHMQVMSASILRPGDCVLVISNSGRTRDLMDACDIARKNGATTIVITASGSPLASAGSIHLSADHPEGFDKYQPHGLAPFAPDDSGHPRHVRGSAHRQHHAAAFAKRHEAQLAQQTLRLRARAGQLGDIRRTWKIYAP